MRFNGVLPVVHHIYIQTQNILSWFQTETNEATFIFNRFKKSVSIRRY